MNTELKYHHNLNIDPTCLKVISKCFKSIFSREFCCGSAFAIAYLGAPFTGNVIQAITVNNVDIRGPIIGVSALAIAIDIAYIAFICIQCSRCCRVNDDSGRWEILGMASGLSSLFISCVILALSQPMGSD